MTKNIHDGKVYSNINRDNYYNYVHEDQAGLETGWLQKNEILDSIYKELNRMKLVVNRDVIFQLVEGISIPLDGYLPYENAGFFVQDGHSGTISFKSRRNKFVEYNKYDANGKHYNPSVEITSPNIFVFEEDWYWYQRVFLDHEKKNFKKDTLFSRQQTIQFLKQDIHDYFDKYVKKKYK